MHTMQNNSRGPCPPCSLPPRQAGSLSQAVCKTPVQLSLRVAHLAMSSMLWDSVMTNWLLITTPSQLGKLAWMMEGLDMSNKSVKRHSAAGRLGHKSCCTFSSKGALFAKIQRVVVQSFPHHKNVHIHESAQVLGLPEPLVMRASEDCHLPLEPLPH